MRKGIIFVALLFHFNLFAQHNDLLGVWENGGRFVEFFTTSDALNMKIVLKPYYRYVYEPTEHFSTSVTSVENFDGLHILRITYPRTKQAVYLPICLIDDLLFTSFFQRNDYTSSEPYLPEEYRPYGITDEQARFAMNRHDSPLYGFWTEQGSRDGILLYPNEAPKYFDAYFFTDTEYFKFRYWLDTLEVSSNQCHFTDTNNITYTVPRVLQRGTLTYSCVTSNSSILRNFEKGVYTLKYSGGLYSLTLTPMGAGPGTNAAKDTYENPKYPEVVNLPLYITEDGKIFSYGEPFLFKTEITNLDEKAREHNSQKKTPIEPQLISDELEFYRERIKELEDMVLKGNQ